MSVNKAIIVGNLGKDPEPIAGGKGCKFSIATNEKWKDKNSGEHKEKTEWHNITVWGRTAENCVKYLRKGRQVYVEGRIETDKYEKDGETRYSTGIVAFNVTFLSGESDGGGARSSSSSGRKKRKQRNQAPAASSGGGWDDDDDDWGDTSGPTDAFDDDDIPF